MTSYWEQKYFLNYDTVIVGAGISGLFTALFLKKKFPEEKILVLEKELFPAASTKNAGFACMGSITELEDDLQTSTMTEVVELFKKRFEGLQLMRTELGDTAIGYEENGSYELIDKNNLSIIDKIEFWNQKLFSVANRNAFSQSDISKTTFAGFSTMVKNELEGEIDTGKMWQSLRNAVQNMGIEIRLNTALTSFEKKEANYQLKIENSFLLKAKRLLFCTNAFVSKLLPSVKITPARAQVLITKPIKNLPFRGIYHFDRGYYYFREIDGRVLFGGGRQLDKAGETTSVFGNTEEILADLESKLHEQILPYSNFEVDYFWSGIMGLANDKNPIMKQHDENFFILAGFGGMGVALAPFMARELVDQIN